MRRAIRLSGVLLACLWPLYVQAETRYEVIDLGTIRGRFAQALSINDAGQIVGWDDAADPGGLPVEGGLWPVPRATLFDPTGAGNNIDLGTLGGALSEAHSINNAGQIVGWAANGQGTRAALFDPTGVGDNIDLGTLGGDDSFACSINEAGQIVGWADNDEGFGRATLFDPTGAGNNTDLGTLSGGSSGAYSINDAGQIVGRAQYGAERWQVHATLFDPTGAGNNIDLGTLAGRERSTAYCINSTGQIVGWAENTCGGERATLFDPTGVGNNIDLGTLGGNRSSAYSINEAGQIVGWAAGSQGWERATLFDPTGAGNNVDLNTLIDPDSGWYLRYAMDINNDGWIVGYGYDPQGEQRSFLLIPKYSGGSGTAEDPYQIATAEDLILLGETPQDYDKHFKLTAHIDLDPNQLGSRVFAGAVIAPDVNPYNDSYDGVPFSGVFDGCGYEIRNMKIIGSCHLGLFGWIGPEAQVSNLSVMSAYVEVEDIRTPGRDGSGPATSQGLLAGANSGEVQTCHTGGSITGCGEWIGGLIGYNLGNVGHCTSSANVQGAQTVGGLVGYHREGQVTDCYSTGTVEQQQVLSANRLLSGDTAGGLAGRNDAYVSRCYATGDVNGFAAVGGLVGGNFGTVKQCYSTGTVAGTVHIGGLVGTNREGEISECYSIGAVTGGGGLVGYNDWIVTHSFWDIETSGQSGSAGGFGMSTAQMHDIGTFSSAGWDFLGRQFDGKEDTWVMETYPVLYTSQLSGKGTIESPYLISEENKVIAFKNMVPSAHYRLTEDIDLSEIEWESSLLDEYSGTFDGGGLSLQNVTIIGGDEALALFGILARNGTIKNLKLGNVFVEGGSNLKGGLVGLNYGSVTHCECTGVVTGSRYNVGGLVGNNQGDVSHCSSTVTVTGRGSVGGIAGENGLGHVSNCSSTATVTGFRRVGGIVGSNNGAVVGCRSNATVSGGDSKVGGIAGENDGDVINCYSTGSVSGDRSVGGLVGRNHGGDITNSYSTSAVTGSDHVGGLVGNNFSENAVITASYWDLQTSGRTNMCGLQEEGAIGCDDSFGLTTAEMQTAATFLDAGWDFVDETANGTEDIWWIYEGQDYPRLYWELGDEASP